MAARKKSKYHKLDLYESSVQSAEDDVLFLARTYQRLRHKKALKFREDFCGTFWLCTEWVKTDSKRIAVGVDLSASTIAYGMKKHFVKLTEDQKGRLKARCQDVRKVSGGFDLICALNFSYFIFRSRDSLREYFQSARRSLAKDGILVMDHFGGPLNMNPQVEHRDCEASDGKRFRYYWEQATFNPITNHSTFYIHYTAPDRVRINKAFTYHWRMWSIAEIREIMLEAGFKDTKVLWELNGDFKVTEIGEDDCEVWICYLVGLA